MQFSSQAITQQCGETKSNAAAAGLSFAPLPGFSVEQTSSILSLFSQVFNRQPNPTSTPPPTQSNSLTKKKTQAQRVTATQFQEMEHSVQISVEKEASKHVVLHRKALWDCVATLWHAVISCVGMTSFGGMIMVQNGAIWRRRMGVG